MDIKELLNSKEVKDRLKHKCNELKKHLDEGAEKCSLVSPYGEDVMLTKENMQLGVFLLNGIKKLRKDNYAGIGAHVYKGETRHKHFLENYNTETIWDEHSALLDYFFGKWWTPYVIKAWHKMAGLTYQVGYYRRSFRAPNRSEYSSVRQINLIIAAVHDTRLHLQPEEYLNNDLNSYDQPLAYIWAEAVESGEEKIYNLLLDIIYNRHPQAKVSRGIIKSLLLTEKPEAHEAVEKLLLSAQRQEGLRQEILECLDETSVMAMKHMIKVIIDNKLTRFSSVVRALDVWVGLSWESEREAAVIRFIQEAHNYLNDTDQIAEGIKDKDNVKVYMALWAQGVLDADKCFPLIDDLLANGSDEKKILALYFAQALKFDKETYTYCLSMLENDKLILQSMALRTMNMCQGSLTSAGISEEKRVWLLNRLYDILETVPDKEKQFSMPFESMGTIYIQKSFVYNRIVKTINKKDDAEVRSAMAHFDKMDLESREQLTRIVLDGFDGWSIQKDNKKKASKLQREYALMGLSDRGELIRTASINALMNAELSDEELLTFEGLLSRKSSELRKQVIELIMKKDDATVKASASRLVEAKNADQRLAGLDMLCQLKKNNNESWISEKAEAFSQRPKISAKEQILLDNLLHAHSALTIYNEENGFGLYYPPNKTVVEQPKALTDGYYREIVSKNPFAYSMPVEEIEKRLADLKKLFEANKNFEYQRKYWDNSTEATLLGNEFTTAADYNKDGTDEEKYYGYPLAEVWKKWFEDSKLTPLDLWLLLVNNDKNSYGGISGEKEFPEIRKVTDSRLQKVKIPKAGNNTYSNPVLDILCSLQLLFPFKEKAEFLHGLVSDILAQISEEDVSRIVEKKSEWSTYSYTWRDVKAISNVWSEYLSIRRTITDNEFEKFWPVYKWVFQSCPEAHHSKGGYLPSYHDYIRAYQQELINKDELMWRLMEQDAIRDLTVKAFKKDSFNYFEHYPYLKEMVQQCRERIFEIELTRGDSSTVVTKKAQNLQVVYGADNFVKLLVAMGKDNLHRGYIYSWGSQEYNKKEVLSTLLKRCWPSEFDTQKEFSQLVTEAKITEKRLVEAAMYAPQWMHFVGSHIKWKGFDTGIWWLHAHTNGDHTAETETEIARFSPVEIGEFKDGAVDVDWFKEAYKALGKAKWKVLYDAAKYVSDGTGHSRAKLYADVIVGNTKITEVRKRIDDKRNQDYVRVFGLVPLSKAKRDADLLKRYQYLQKFKKESRQFGSQRQASEGLAVKVAMENLARNAGYSDPIRLTWAMETEEAKAILNNAERLVFDDLEIWLDVDEHGKSSIKCTRKGKALKSVPAKFNKDKAVVELKEFHKTLKNQYSRTRKSLEEAMVSGQVFYKSEVETLMQHPVVKPMLEKLVLKSGDHLGFWSEGKLESASGEMHECGEDVSIAHCTDLHEDGHWSDYQHYCFIKEIAQPFKQIFREMYLPTADELEATSVSKRYAGHQVQPKKTVALLKTKGWTVDYEEGLQKVFHKEGFIAKMYAMADWFSPADVESPTLETVEFIDRKTYKNVPFEKIDKRIFSEIMRDVDLVVSVAHVGDVDPEASHSSMEMRAVLVEEVAKLFKLKNSKVEGRHVFINGSMGDYTVHLGSAVCHKQPGGYLSILPVHSQHRGRLFLPFVDDDPKSAELMSKVIMLAKDNEIQDPTILRQIQRIEVEA